MNTYLVGYIRVTSGSFNSVHVVFSLASFITLCIAYSYYVRVNEVLANPIKPNLA